MIFATYPVLAAFAAGAVFYYAWLWLKTPFYLNVFGGVCVVLAVLSLGAASAYPFVPYFSEEAGTVSLIVTALKFIGLAVLAYVSGYFLRAYALKVQAEIDADVNDEIGKG